MTLAGHTGSWRVPYLPRNAVDRTPFILKQVQFPTCLEGMFYPFSKHHMHVCQPILLLDKYRSYGEDQACRVWVRQPRVLGAREILLTSK